MSNSLRELQGWGIVRIVHVMGDRRDHFETIKDVWEMFRLILDERKKRECDPTLALLREAVTDAKKPGIRRPHARAIADLLQFFELMTTWYDQTRKMPTPAVLKFVKMGDKGGADAGCDVIKSFSRRSTPMNTNPKMHQACHSELCLIGVHRRLFFCTPFPW